MSGLNDEEKKLNVIFRQIYEKTHSKVMGTLRYTFGNDPNVEDIFQEIYMAVWCVLLQNKDEESVLKQVYGIAKHKRKDYLRKLYPASKQNQGQPGESKRQSEIYPLDISDIAETELSLEESNELYLPGAIMDDTERRKEICAIVDGLAAGQKSVCKLFYYEGDSVKEVAKCLDVAENTVKAQLHKGRKAIEKSLRMEAQNGNRLYGIAGMVGLSDLLQTAMAQSTAAVPAEWTQTILSEIFLNAAAVQTATGAAAVAGETAAATTAAATAAETATAATAATAPSVYAKLFF